MIANRLHLPVNIVEVEGAGEELEDGEEEVGRKKEERVERPASYHSVQSGDGPGWLQSAFFDNKHLGRSGAHSCRMVGSRYPKTCNLFHPLRCTALQLPGLAIRWWSSNFIRQ